LIISIGSKVDFFRLLSIAANWRCFWHFWHFGNHPIRLFSFLILRFFSGCQCPFLYFSFARCLYSRCLRPVCQPHAPKASFFLMSTLIMFHFSVPDMDAQVAQSQIATWGFFFPLLMLLPISFIFLYQKSEVNAWLSLLDRKSQLPSVHCCRGIFARLWHVFLFLPDKEGIVLFWFFVGPSQCF